jgi:hypothetical protein
LAIGQKDLSCFLHFAGIEVMGGLQREGFGEF